MFDGSSIAGWKAINESDMVLMPDPASAHMDPFYAQTTMAIFCDILEPTTGEGYGRDPRMTAKKAEAYLKQAKIGDTVFVGPEAEFFIFDDVRFSTPLPTSCRSTNTRSTPWRIPTAMPQPSCRNRYSATTARACTAISRCGRMASR